MAHGWTVGVATGEPVEVVILIETAVLALCITLLVEEDGVYVLILGVGKLYLPVDQTAVHLNPFAPVHSTTKLHSYLTELLLVVHHRMLRHKTLLGGQTFDS